MNEDGISRRAALQGAVGAAAAPFFAQSVAGDWTDDNDDTELVRGVRLAPGKRPWREVTIAFGSDVPEDGEVERATIRWGTGESLDNSKRAGVGEGTDLYGSQGTGGRALPGGRYVYRFELSDLEPETTYRYQVGVDNYQEQADAWSEVHEFTTAPLPSETGEFTVAQFGDHGVDDDSNPCNRTKNHRPRYVIDRVKAIDPEFLMVSGDISYANGKPSTWEQYFEVNQHLFANTPIVSAVGNHEREPGLGFQQYDGHLNQLMPIDNPALEEEGGEVRKQRWHDFQYGNAIFITLDIETGCVGEGGQFYPLIDNRVGNYDDGYCDQNDRLMRELVEGPQLNYLKETLERAEADDSITWKVVQFHHPMVASSIKHSDNPWAREVWGPLFDEYNVDLVLQGDNHMYDRSRPLRVYDAEASADAPGHGTTYITNGTGGISFYGIQWNETDPAETAVLTNQAFGVTQMTFSEESILVKYVDWATGEAFDEFRIRKDDKGRPMQSPEPDGPGVTLQKLPKNETTEPYDGAEDEFRAVTPETIPVSGSYLGYRPGEEVTFEYTLETPPEYPRPDQRSPYAQGRPPVRMRVQMNGDLEVVRTEDDDVQSVETAAGGTIKYIYLFGPGGGPARESGTARFTVRVPEDEETGDRYNTLIMQLRDPRAHLPWSKTNIERTIAVTAPENGLDDDNCANRF